MTERNAIPGLIESERSREIVIVQSRIAVGLSESCNRDLRYLQNRTVRARPASVAYRLRKYVQRNRIAVTVAASAVVLLVAFAVAQSIQLKRITRERDRADRITEFMTSLFTMSNPSEARGNSVTAREILDKSSKDIGIGLSNDPELQAQMMYTMAVTYRGLGLYSLAQPLQERALEIQRRALGPQHPDTLRSMNLLASTLGDAGHDADAEKMSREVLEIRRRVLGSRHPDTLHSMVTLGGKHTVVRRPPITGQRTGRNVRECMRYDKEQRHAT